MDVHVLSRDNIGNSFGLVISQPDMISFCCSLQAVFHVRYKACHDAVIRGCCLAWSAAIIGPYWHVYCLTSNPTSIHVNLGQRSTHCMWGSGSGMTGSEATETPSIFPFITINELLLTYPPFFSWFSIFRKMYYESFLVSYCFKKENVVFHKSWNSCKTCCF